jgi:cytochrome c oxidase subunit IV
VKAGGYLVMLGVLLAFSGAEFGASRLALAPATVLGALVLLVVAQTGYFVLVSMHLKDETAALRRVAALPLVLGAVYAAVLMSESVWRHQ